MRYNYSSNNSFRSSYTSNLNKYQILGISFGLALFVALLTYFITVAVYTNSKTSDTEYWGDLITEVRYYEEWDEWIEETCYKTVSDGKDANGNEKTHQEPYDCSYRKYHSPEYIAYTSKCGSYYIEKEEYLRLKAKWNNSTFEDMNRDYYHIDGDMYFTKYDGSLKNYEQYAVKKTYENRINNSNSVYKFSKVDTSEVRNYKLFEYPDVYGYYKQKSVLGLKNDSLDFYFNYLNSYYGPKKQVKVFLLFFNSKSNINAIKQEQYWKGGNKNEIVICLGKDSRDSINWCYVFSWSKSELFKKHIYNNIMFENNTVAKLKGLYNYLYEKIPTDFQRREFKEFSYIKINLPIWIFFLVVSIFFVTLLTTYFLINQNN